MGKVGLVDIGLIFFFLFFDLGGSNMFDLSVFGFVMLYWFYWGWFVVMLLFMMVWDKWSSKYGGDEVEFEKMVFEF